MKKKNPKRPKRYNPVRVSNPGVSQCARLHPRQGINIVLDSPSSLLTNVSEDAEYEVYTLSPYLALDAVTLNKKGQKVYSFIQKYDLTNWSEVSELFLGEIRVELVNNTHEKKDEQKYEGSVIGVYHVPSCSTSDVLTVVNPVRDTIKLEPHRTLEVICYESAWEEQHHNEEWTYSIEDFEVEAEGVFLEEIKKHWFTTRVIGNDRNTITAPSKKNPQSTRDFIALPRSCPSINPLLEERDRVRWASELDRQKCPGRQYHFWFSFTQASIKKISDLKTGDYVAARITLKGTAIDRSEKPVKTEREFILMLSKHGKPVATGDGMKSFPINTMTCAPTKREFDRHRSLLINPGLTEQLDFCTGFEDCYVEIAVPKVYWEAEPDGAVWSLEKDNGQAGECLDVCALGVVEKFNTKYQRFKIARKMGQVGTSNGFLGAIKVIYRPKQHIHEATKRISVWMNFKKTAGNIYGGCSGGSRGFVHYKNGLGNYENPKVAILKVEEIKCTSLADGEITKKLKDVHSYNASDWEEYYYGIPVQAAMTKKKENTVSNHILGNPSKNSSDRSIPGNVEEGNTTQTTTAIDPIILNNPAHLQEITLLPEQEVIIRLMPPEDVLTRQEDREKCRGELWTPTAMAVADVRPIVVRHRVSPAGTDRYRQEIIIKADIHRLPQYKGNHCMGAIKLECSAVNRILRIHVKKDMDTEQPQDINFLGKFPSLLTGMPMHEANGRRYFLAQNWKHGNGVALKKSDVLYVRQPDDCDADWGNDDWSVQFVQHPISPQLWERMPNEVRNVVDRMRPWYSKDHPIFMHKTLFFKALDQSASSAMPKMLEELSKIVMVDYFPMATVIFESVKMQVIEDEIGVVETCVKLQREIRIFATLERKKPEKTNDFPIYYPSDGAIIQAKIGDILSFHLAPISYEEGGYCVWSCISYPTFLQESGPNHGYSKVAGDDTFKFRVAREGEECIRFRAGQENRAVKVKTIPREGEGNV